MNLDELNTLARDAEDEVEEEDICKIEARVVKDPHVLDTDAKKAHPTPADDDDEPQSLEEDLTDALDLLEQALLMMENMKVHRKRIVYVPAGMQDLMEEMADLLDQYEIKR